MQNIQARKTGVGLFTIIGSFLAICAIACVCALAGCGSATAAKATLSDSVDGDTAVATVTAVDGSTITLTAKEGSMPNGEPPAKPDGDSGNGAPSGEPPAKPDGDSSDGTSGNEPPAKPDGDSDNGAPSGEPPAKPEDATADQETSGSTPPDAPGAPADGTQMTLSIPDESIIFTSKDGKEEQGSLADITEGAMLQLAIENGTDVMKIIVNPDGMGGQPGGGPGAGSSTVNNGTGATTLEDGASTTGETYNSTNTDENAVRTENGVSATVTDATITKTGDSSSSEDSDFYGLNAAVLAYDASKLTLKGGTVTSDSSGSNGIFAYGEGTEVTVSDTTIRTTKGNSGGVEVAGGATLSATNLNVDTQGESSAAIRSDRGGGTETITGGSYATHGKHSPAVYSTADVMVNDASLTAENCEAVVIEGKNSVALNDCEVTGNINGVATRTDVVNNVMIYQSMSGDASEGTGNFSMSGGTFTAANGTLFYVTNTDAVIELEAVDIDHPSGQLLVVAGNDGQWGKEGSNGGTVKFTATEQKLDGSITVDSISSLDLTLTESVFTGSINSEKSAGTVNITLEEGATWTLDADSYITSLSGDTAGIDLNGHTLYVNGEAWTA